jgi:RND family efflux transporter MFP subunit
VSTALASIGLSLAFAPTSAPVFAPVFAPGPAAQGGNPSAVRVAPVTEREIGERRMVTGDVRALRRSLVAAQEPGLLLELPLREGTPVEAGGLLARLDAESLALELRALVGELRVQEAVLSERRRTTEWQESDYQTLKGLSEKGAANPKEILDAESELKIAQARQEQAERDLEQTRTRIELLEKRIRDTEIRAPFAGTVVARRKELGEWVARGDAVVELVSGEVEAWIEVPQRYYAPLCDYPEPLRLRADATGEVLRTDSYRVVEDVDPRSRTFRVIAPLEREWRLAPGMSLSAWVPTGERAPHLTVSKDAILRNDAGAYVYVVQPGAEGAPAQAVPLPVEVLFYSADDAVLRAGRLAPGTEVVVEGNERLFPMAPIRPVRADGAGSGAKGSGDAGAGDRVEERGR